MVVRFLSFRQVEWNSFSTFQLCEKLYQGKELVPYHNNIFWLPFTLIKESETAWKLGKDAASLTLINHNLAVLYRDIWIIQPNITSNPHNQPSTVTTLNTTSTNFQGGEIREKCWKLKAKVLKLFIRKMSGTSDEKR